MSLVMALLVVGAASCKKSGSGSATDPSSPTAPTNPKNTSLSGTWNGTLTRPGDLGSIAVRWVASQDASGQLSGPFTMTYGGVSLPAQLSGIFGTGSDNLGSLVMQILLQSGQSAALPTCSIRQAGLTVTGLPVGATSMTSGTFDITYDLCAGFIAPSGITNFTRESTVLSMTRQ